MNINYGSDLSNKIEIFCRKQVNKKEVVGTLNFDDTLATVFAL